MEASEGSKPSRYRTTRIALILGVLLIGFTRLEDRAILGIPGPGASACRCFKSCGCACRRGR